MVMSEQDIMVPKQFASHASPSEEPCPSRETVQAIRPVPHTCDLDRDSRQVIFAPARIGPEGDHIETEAVLAKAPGLGGGQQLCSTYSLETRMEYTETHARHFGTSAREVKNPRRVRGFRCPC